MELATEVIKDPDKILDLFSRVVFDKLRQRDLVYAEAQKKIHVRFRALPSITQLRKIGSEHIGRLVMVKGIIVRASATTPQVMKAVFRCSNCNELNYVEQDGEILKTPIKCEHCDSKTRFDLVPKLSVFMDSQRVTTQERPEDLPPGQLPRSLHVDLKDDIVDQARPGDRITIVGSVDLLQRFGRGGQLRIFDMVMEASHIEVSGREAEMTDISPEDEEKIKEIAQDPWVHRRLLQSIAPSIYGHENIKESILYLLFGGINKDLPDMRIRGDINVLLVGDPGTGKSQLLQFAAKIAPRGLMTTGRGSTAAGLTAAVVKEGGTGNFILEAGALVLADQGICCIDEIDKMREEDRGAIHPAMEQQIVPIAKGGIVATLNASTSILAAANPTLGRYNPYQTIGQNINLPVTILSRFDVIFVLKDVPDAEKDATMAEHILGLHRSARLHDYLSYRPRAIQEVHQLRQDARSPPLQRGGHHSLQRLLRQDEDSQRRGWRGLGGQHHGTPAGESRQARRGTRQGTPPKRGHEGRRRGGHHPYAEQPGAGRHRRLNGSDRHRHPLHG